MGIPVRLPHPVSGKDLLTIIEEVARDSENIRHTFRFPSERKGLIPGSVQYGDFVVGETVVMELKERDIKRSILGTLLHLLAVLFGASRPRLREIELLPINADQLYSNVEFQLLITDGLDSSKIVIETKESGFEDFHRFVEKLFERIKA